MSERSNQDGLKSRITEGVSKYSLMTNRDMYMELFSSYHKGLAGLVDSTDQFNSIMDTVLDPDFVMLYGDMLEGYAIIQLQNYCQSLSPTIQVESTRKVLSEDGSKGGKKKSHKYVPVLDNDGKPVYTVEPLFKLMYAPLAVKISQRLHGCQVYWKAHTFAKKAIPTVDEKMFDRLNDYLWRNIMAVVYPDDVKREFKHLCINIKRKLYYLGDRDKVHNQTTFGLYSEQGGNGKTTLMQSFANAFSNHNRLTINTWDDLFGFNKKSFDKFGVAFVDEDPPSEKKIKDKLKKFIDSDTRELVSKGVDGIDAQNLLTLVVSANHKISSRLFEDESRGQRRDAFFEVIGVLHQITEADMTRYFDRMFATCPIDDDEKTYRHSNHHQKELTDTESTVLLKVWDLFYIGESPFSNYDSSKNPPYANIQPKPMKLGQLQDKFEIKSKDERYYALKSLLKTTDFFSCEVDSARGKWYLPNKENIRRYLCSVKKSYKNEWSRDWRDNRPYLDIDEAFSTVEAKDYNPSAPIDYSVYFDKDAATLNEGGKSDEEALCVDKL